MTNIKSSKAAGLDKLSGRFFKNGTNILVKFISAVCNLSISQGFFPNACKVAKLKPIFKNGKKTDPSNYRPISLLSSILKIIERVILTKQMRYYQMKIYNYQSRFRSNHSKNLCLSFLTNKVLKGFDEGLFTRMILVDLQKAFDTIDHKISLQKLKVIKFFESTVNFFFFFCNRAKNIHQLNNKYKGIDIKQYLEVLYLGCLLSETMSGEPMALKVLNKQ